MILSSLWLSLALAILGKMMKFGYEPSIITLNPLLNGYCHCKRISEAVALVDQMVELGYQPNTVTFNTLIRGLYLTKKASEALAFVDRMMLKGHSVVISDQLHRALKKQVASLEYHTIGQSFNFQAALQDLSQPNAEASQPDGVLTVPLLKHQRIALSWMAQRETTGLPCSGGFLADDQGLGKTVSIIALILKERSKSAQACEESIKKEFFDLESESGASDHSQLPFNENIVGGDSVGKARGKPASGTLVVCPTSVMRQWAGELHKNVTSEANLSVLVYHGSSRLKDRHELAKYDVVVTTYSIVSMEVPKQPLVDDEDKEKSGVHDGSKKRGSKKKKDVEVLPGPLAKVSWFRVVLDEAQSIKNYKTQVARAWWGLCEKVEQGMELFREMSQRGLVGNTVTYNTLIQGFFQAADCEKAQEVFKQMESDGVPPSIMTYSILLNGLCNNGKLETALVVFNDLQKSEMELDIYTYNIMIEGMCKVGRVEDGWDLFCSLSLKRVKPDVVTYNTMISGFCKKGLKEKADALFRKMKEDGPLPNSGTYNTLIRARLRDGDKAASAELIKEMRSCGFAGDASTIALVTNMLHDGRLDKSFLDMLS
ncbi:Pentatricopeptide repeat-containing protein [Cardamine amara subsp. amara]|uniref:Pentatricopeptide repeat-containing protein n=1 Tax=Cardamine amara subsp. amara TaxID=228776 RepID=A0ABD1AW47_CARAN